MTRRLSLFVAASLLTICAPGCGAAEGVCGPVVHDALDVSSGVHILPGAPTPSYLVDPPTSGAHQPGPNIPGPSREPIAKQLQIGVLEEGRVLIQYSDLEQADVKRLEALDSDDVLVAPAASLPGDTRVAATAWVTHQNCTAVDIDALVAFSEHFAGKGPGGH
ncbi:MAG TPA: DUF3105 domain-containing protein [Acidimicrobiales bacterium]|nr:DUF3105 domain-containing protein [Acidimicrobiales bacterium]